MLELRPAAMSLDAQNIQAQKPILQMLLTLPKKQSKSFEDFISQKELCFRYFQEIDQFKERFAKDDIALFRKFDT